MGDLTGCLEGGSALEEAPYLEQAESSLFKLPPELREVIWRLIVAAEDDPARPYDTNTHHCRPGQLAFKRIDTAILSTCRRIYEECRSLPLSANTMTFWCYRGPRGEPTLAKLRQQSIWQTVDTDLEEDDTPWHFEPFRRNDYIPIKYIKHALWFVQQYWLECDNFYYMTVSPEMANIETLTVTLRRSDFWNWEQLRPIGIDPRWPAAVTQTRMKDIWARDIAGTPIVAHPEAWGSHIQNLKALQRFTLEMEGELTQKEELLAIVQHAAKYWTFAHHTGKNLRCIKPSTTEEWVGPPCMATGVAPADRLKARPRLIKFSISFDLPE